MISTTVLQYRRKTLLSKMTSCSAILIFASPENIMKQNEYHFCQNKDFWYFTCFDEPNALLVLIKQDEFNNQQILFNKPKDCNTEIWVGPCLGQNLAKIRIGVDYALSWDNIDKDLSKLLNNIKILYHAWNEYIEADKLVFNTLRCLRNGVDSTPPNTIIDWRPLVHEMRLFKEPEEIKLLRTSCKITSLAHTRAMKSCYPGMFEYQLEGEIHHEFNYHGARQLAYNTIIGSGYNACILHYTKNKDKMRDGDLVLVDAGCSFKGYASDITRTFPINGKFSKQQREIYNIVLTSLKCALLMLKPEININEVNHHVINIMVKHLVQLRLLKGIPNKLISEGAYLQFFMHNLGHWLGLDVHDVGSYGTSINNRILKPNMVLTVEPGLYISKDADVPIEYRGIGVRIEDNIIITKNGNECFTDSVVKEIDQIEFLMASRKNLKNVL
ncbi:Xaa-Pro aminopeptidase [Candidatus Pantoea edessiphila]|uniref:Xaa-Pro aminopeptidase n=1 Tax=Candidatus Pantoea edessiphila TaxID=2044610 RepID=A0A2P5SVS0_9GAMM|nr:Xaa-Pro aminopeptidase [Candidatus Pantoea edessiphila]PPI86410.1 Xaa-Pro aminopeptidase [Candidatus Pantoea edessiphila]